MASTVDCNAVFVAAIGRVTNAMSSSRDKSSGTHPFCLHSSNFHCYHTDTHATNIRQSVKRQKKDLTSHTVSSVVAQTAQGEPTDASSRCSTSAAFVVDGTSRKPVSISRASPRS